MSFINKEYDPNCMVSYVEVLISQMNSQGKSLGEGAVFTKLQYLIAESDCVDKGVIAEIIRYGTNITSDLVSAEQLTRLSYPMILQSSNVEKDLPCDTRAAFAIRAGLIEMCLNFIGRLGDNVDDCTLSLLDNVKKTLKTVHSVSLHQKTAKAIRSKRSSIEENLVHLEQSIDITNKKLLDMVKSILDINGSYCCRCNKSLSRTYCSRACQREDWINGHSVACCESFTNETAGQFQGFYEPDIPDDERAATKMKEMEINMNMIQLKLLLDNSEDILRQAEALELPLYDCVVCFDLCKCPPTFVVDDYKENFLKTEAVKGFEETRSKENITCDYYSQIFNGEFDEDGDAPRLCTQRLFPHEWLTNKKK